MRVSVVVPVFDPGRYLHDLLASLRAQTLDPAEFEVVLVDDGSTDGSAEVLDAAAAETPNLRVLHTPNSGWPGRPRNIGIDAARADYVFLCDHDDRLDPEALQRLTDFAIEHGSDVVVGRVVGVGRPAPERIFARTLVDAQQDLGLLFSSLTPQKLYRRAFLDEQDIRFPEGPRRLEDHLFVTKAYLRARRVSIYADHPVYYFVLRDDGRNASRRPIEWHGYYANAAESIAVVDGEAPDEATRVLLRRRWLRTEALARLRGKRLVEQPDRADLLHAVRELLQRHYPAAEVDLLSPPERLIGRLLLDGREDDVVAFAAWEAAIRVRVEVVDAALDEATGRLCATLRAAAHPVSPLPDALRDLPAGLPTAAELERAAALPDGARLAARFAGPDGAAVDAAVQQRMQEGVLTGTLDLDPASPPLAPGDWRLRVTMSGAGRTRVEPARAAEAIPATGASIRSRRLRLATGRTGALVLRVEATGARASLRRGGARALRAPGRLVRRARRGLRRA